MIRKPVILFGLLIVSLLLYIILVRLGDFRSQIEYYLLISAILFAIYLIFVILGLRTKDNLPVHWAWFIVFALLSRLVLFPASPTLSQEVYRYIWTGGTILECKMVLLFIEVILVFLLIQMLRHFSLSLSRMIIFLYNPLLVIETYHSGHFEIIAVMFLWLAIFAFYKQKDRLAFGGFLLSILAKFLFLMPAIPFLFKRFWRKFFLMIFICLVISLLLSMNNINSLTVLVSGLNLGSFTGAIFKSVTCIMDMMGLPVIEIVKGLQETIYVNSAFYYLVIALLAFIIVSFDQMRKLKVTSDYRSINYLQASFLLTGALLLLLPHLPPWYLIAVVPFLIFLPNWSWLSFTCLIQLSYYGLKKYTLTGSWQESNWILLAIYVPFYTLLIWEYLDRRQIKGWFLNIHESG